MKLSSKKQGHSLMHFRVKGKSVSRFRMFPKVRTACQTQGDAPVYLNVYDLTPMNGYTYWAGIGIFHSGIEVHGVEYAFGAHDYSSSGVFEVEPRQCPGFRYRKSIFMGTTFLNPDQLKEFIERQSVNYYGDTYHLINKNCNHFCKDMCYRLTGNSIPKWVNRLARIGSLCSCLLPEALSISAARREQGYESYRLEKQRLRSPYNCLSSMSMSRRRSSASSQFLETTVKG